MEALLIDDRARGRDNNFHLVRMIAATLVLVSHSWPLTGTPGEPLERFADFSLGHLGVDLFFIVSGFLVTGSLVTRPSLLQFGQARAWRIFPALIANAFGTAFVIGPFVTTWPLDRYLAAWDTWRYALQNSCPFPLGVRWFLPGTFRGNPGGPAANGALWSLPWELTMYVLLALLGALVAWRLFRSRGIGLSTLVPLVAITATAGHAANEALGLTQKFELVQGLRLTALFFTAGGLQLARNRVPLRGDWALLAALLLPGVLFLKGASLGLYPILLAYLVLWFALVPGGVLVHYRRLGDYSYGLYLWQFPVQQCLVRAIPALVPGALIALSFPITLVLAMLSWRFIEAPALARKPAAEVRP